MSNSGNVTSNGYQGRCLYFEWWTNSVSSANNTRTIGWRLTAVGGTSRYYYHHNNTMDLNGDRQYTGGSSDYVETDEVLAEGTYTINQNNTTRLRVDLDGGIYVNYDNINTAEEWDLDTIPRYTSITSFTVSKRNETSVTYNFSMSDVCDYAEYSTDNGSNWTGVDITDGKSASFNVTGLSPNTTYNFKVRVRRKDSQLKTESGTVQQTTYKVPTQSVSSKTETSITMAWSVDSTADYIWYSKDNGNNWTAVGSVNATSGSYTISNLTANTGYNIKTRVRRKASQTTYDTANLAVSTYDYPYVTAVGSNPLTIGNSQSLTLYNPLGRTVTVKMYQTNTSGTQLYSGTTSVVTGTPFTFTPNASTLYSSIPSSQDSYCVYSITYGSSTKTTATNTYKYKITGNEKPTFSNFTYADTNATTTALTGNNQILVNGYSNVTATVSAANKAIANNSTTMKDYTLSIGSKSARTDYSSSSDVSMSVTGINSGTVKVTANDNRGLGTVVEKSATFKNYSKPTVTNLSATRGSNGVGETVTLTFSGTWWNDSFGLTSNNIQYIKYYFRKSTTNTWTTGTTTLTFTTSGNTFNGSVSIAGDTSSQGFAAADSYYIKIIVTDQLSNSEEFQTTIGAGTPSIGIYKDNVAIGQQYDTSAAGKLQVNGNMINKGDIYLPNNAATGGQQIKWSIGANDYARVYGGATASNAGYLELATGDDSNEPIYVRQYSGNFATVARTVTLLDGSGNTSFPGTVSGTFSGNITGDVTGNVTGNCSGTSANVTQKITASSKTHTNYNTNQGYVPAMSFLSYWNGAYNSSNSSNLTYAHEGTIQCKPKNLYNNTTGTTGNVTLSETCANFTYIEIYCYDTNQSAYFSLKIYAPNGKRLALGGVVNPYGYNDFIRFPAKILTASGTTLTVNNYSTIQWYQGNLNAHNNKNEIYIVRVDGYK